MCDETVNHSKDSKQNSHHWRWLQSCLWGLLSWKPENLLSRPGWQTNVCRLWLQLVIFRRVWLYCSCHFSAFRTHSTFVRDNFWGTLKRLQICHLSGNYLFTEWQQCITDKTLPSVGGMEPVVHWKLVPDTLLGPKPPVANHWTWLHNPTLVIIPLCQIPLACV